QNGSSVAKEELLMSSAPTTSPAPAQPEGPLNALGQLSRAFLSQLRHDLRTPVNAIIGYSEMLLEDAEDDAPEDFLARLRQLPPLGKRLLAVINEQLDASRAERDDIDPELFGADVRGQLEGPCREVGSHCDALLQQAEHLSLQDFVPDLQRIREAG